MQFLWLHEAVLRRAGGTGGLIDPATREALLPDDVWALEPSAVRQTAVGSLAADEAAVAQALHQWSSWLVHLQRRHAEVQTLAALNHMDAAQAQAILVATDTEAAAAQRINGHLGDVAGTLASWLTLSRVALVLTMVAVIYYIGGGPPNQRYCRLFGITNRAESRPPRRRRPWLRRWRSWRSSNWRCGARRGCPVPLPPAASPTAQRRLGWWRARWPPYS